MCAQGYSAAGFLVENARIQWSEKNFFRTLSHTECQRHSFILKVSLVKEKRGGGIAVQDLSKAVDFPQIASMLLFLFLSKDNLQIQQSQRSVGQAAFRSHLTLAKGTREKKLKEGGRELDLEGESILLRQKGWREDYGQRQTSGNICLHMAVYCLADMEGHTRWH